MVQAVIWKSLERLLRRSQIVQEHVKRVEGLNKVVIADKLDISEIFVNQQTFPLAFSLLIGTTTVGIQRLNLGNEEELIELLVCLDSKLGEICANGASQTRGHKRLQVELSAGDQGLENL